MPWERFTESNKSFAPRASISKSGYIGFSEGAIQRYDIREYSHAVLFYNPTDRLVGILLTKSNDEPGARQIKFRTKGAEISAKPFLQKNSIERLVTSRYDLGKDEESGYLTITVDAGQKRRSKRGNKKVEKSVDEDLTEKGGEG